MISVNKLHYDLGSSSVEEPSNVWIHLKQKKKQKTKNKKQTKKKHKAQARDHWTVTKPLYELMKHQKCFTVSYCKANPSFAS